MGSHTVMEVAFARAAITMPTLGIRAVGMPESGSMQNEEQTHSRTTDGRLRIVPCSFGAGETRTSSCSWILSACSCRSAGAVRRGTEDHRANMARLR